LKKQYPGGFMIKPIIFSGLPPIRKFFSPFQFTLGLLLIFLLWGGTAQGETTDVSASISLTTANERSVMDRRTRMVTSTADVTLTNSSSESISSPLHAVIEILNTDYSNVTMPDALGGDGIDPYGKYYYDLSGELTNGVLLPGQSVTFGVKFVRFFTIRFQYKVATYGNLEAGPVNQTPTADPGGPYSGMIGQSITFDGSGSSDPDGDTLTYAWDFGDGATGINEQPIHTYAAAGTYTVKLIVSDGQVQSDPVSTQVTVAAPNTPPVADAGPNQTLVLPSGQAQMALTLNGSGSDDSDGTIAGYAWSGTPDPEDIARPVVNLSEGTYTFTLSVTDNDGASSAPASVTITVQTPDNEPPVIDAAPELTGPEMEPLTCTITGSDPDENYPLSFSYNENALPSASSFSSTGENIYEFSWHPGYDHAGDYTVTFTITDSQGLTSTRDLIIHVTNVNRSPVLDPVTPKSVSESTLLEFTVSGADPDGDTLTYNGVSLPDGSTFDSSSRIFRWTPAFGQANTAPYGATFTATDPGGLSHTIEVLITVNQTNRPPQLDFISDQTVDEGVELTFQLTGNDPDGNTLTFSGQGLPSGAVIDQHTGLFSWSPGFYSAGSYPVTFMASDGDDMSNEIIVTILVNDINRSPEIITSAIPDGRIDQEYRFLIQANDPDGDELLYTITQSPSGMVISSEGRLSAWAPGIADIGEYNVAVVVSDNRGGADSKTYTLSISDTIPPSLKLNAPAQTNPGLTVTVEALASDNDGIAALEINENRTNYSSPYQSNRSIQQQITIPSLIGPYTVQARVWDLNGNTAQKSAEINVTATFDTTPPQIRLNVPSQVAPGQTILLTASASDDVGVSGITFYADGSELGAVPAGSPSIEYRVASDAAANTTLQFTATAVDFSGNSASGDASSVVVVSGQEDTTEPEIQVTTPGLITEDDIIPVVVETPGENCLAQIDVYVNHTLAASYFAPDATNFDVPVPEGIEEGMDILFEVVVTDCSGNKNITGTWLNVGGASRGVITGEIYSDRTGLPLEDVDISMFTEYGDEYATLSDERGKFSFIAREGLGRLSISKPGYTQVERTGVHIPADTGIETFDARLTPVDSETAVSAVLGENFSKSFSGIIAGFNPVFEDTGIDASSIAAGEIMLEIPPGGLLQNQKFSITQISPQGLAGLLPGGWSPLGVVDIAPYNVHFQTPATLTIPDMLDIRSTSAVILARWDESAHAWRTAAEGYFSIDQKTINAAISASGQYAFLLPDAVPTPPPDPVIGELLAGISVTPLLSDQVSATVNPDPSIVFYTPGVHSDVGIHVSENNTYYSSGTPLISKISEGYLFYSGNTLATEPFTQDFVLYSFARDSLTAAFPVTPSYTFEALSLNRGVITVDVLAPFDAGRSINIITSNGGAITTDTEESITIPEDAVSEDTPVDISPLSLDSSGIDLPAELIYTGGVSISFGGSTLSLPATLSIPAPDELTDQDQVILVRLEEIQGATRFVLAGLCELISDRLVSGYESGWAMFDGVYKSGRYLFIQVPSGLGFASGDVIATSGNLLSGALVTNAELPVISISRTDGGYTACLPVNTFTLSALNMETMDSGNASGTISQAGEIVEVNISLKEEPPFVVSTSPLPDAQNIPLETAIKVIFSEPLDPLTVNGETAALTGPDGTVEGTLSLKTNNCMMVFRPASALSPDTIYTFTLNTGIKDLAGYTLESPYSLAFTSLDTIPPPAPEAGAISATIPEDQGTTAISATQGTAGPHDTVKIINKTQDISTPVLINENGSFSAIIDANIIDEVVISITDPAGNETVVSVGPFHNPDGSTVIGPEGGYLVAENGVIIDISAGTFPNGAVVRVAGLSEAQIGIPTGSNFPFVAGFEIISSAWPEKYLNASAPLPSGISPDARGIVAIVSEAFGEPALSIVDTARVIAGRLATSSPPCPGVVARTARYGMYMNGYPAMAMEQALLSIVSPETESWVMDVLIETEMERYSAYMPLYADSFSGIYHAAAGPASMEYAGQAYAEMYQSLCMPIPADQPLKVIIRDLDTGDIMDVVDIAPVLSGNYATIDYDFNRNDTDPPAVLESKPIHKTLDIYNKTIQIKFSEPISPTSVSTVTLVATDDNQTVFQGNWELQENNSLLVFETVRPLPMGKHYRLNLTEVEDMAGNKYHGEEILFSTFNPYPIFPTSMNRLDRNSIANDLNVNVEFIPSNLWFTDVDFITKSPEESVDGKWHTDLAAIQAGEESGYRLFYMDLTDPTAPSVKSAFKTDNRFSQKRIRLLDDVLITPRPDASGNPQFWKERELHFRTDDPAIRICAAPGSPELAAWQEFHCQVDPDDPNATGCDVAFGGCGDLAVTAVDNTKYSYLWSYDVTDFADPVLENRIKWVSSRLLSDNGVDYGNIRYYEAPAGMGTTMGLATLSHMDIDHGGMLNEDTVGTYVANYGIGLELVDLGLNLPTINDEDRRAESLDQWAINESLKMNIQLYYRDVAVVRDKIVAIASDIVSATNIHTLEIFSPDLSGEPTGMTWLPNRPKRLATVIDFPVVEDQTAEPVLYDLAFVTGENGGIAVVEIPAGGSNPQQQGFIQTPDGVVTKDIQIDRETRVAYVSALKVDPDSLRDHLLVVDLSNPFAQKTDEDNDGWDDRIIGKIPIAFPASPFPVYLHGFRLDPERGLIYAGVAVGSNDPNDKHGLVVIKVRECPDLGVDFMALPANRYPEDIEKQALQQVILNGLTAGAVDCDVSIDGITMIEQGSGSCIWKGNDACQSSYQQGISDHDFEVFFPAAIPEEKRQCIIDALYNQIWTPSADPIPINVQGYNITFRDVSFYPMTRENFEKAELDIHPPTGDQGDIIGDMGLGRQILLLKWLIEGCYVDVPGMDLKGKAFKDIFNILKTPWDIDNDGEVEEPTHIPRLEGYEWAKLQEAMLYDSGALIRIRDAAKAGTTLNQLFTEELHKTAKEAIRAVMAKIIADDTGNETATDFEYGAPRCIEVENSYIPYTWKTVPCDSFAQYIASIAARIARDYPEESLFTPEDIVDKIYQFYRVKSGKEEIKTEQDANEFISMALQFIQDVGNDSGQTKNIYDQTIVNDPRQAQREINISSVLQKIQEEQTTGEKHIVPRIFNKGSKEIDATIWTRMFTGNQETEKENTDPEAGDYIYVDTRKDPALNPDNPDDLVEQRKNVNVFKIEANQTNPEQKGWVSLFVDIPDKNTIELDRENNWAKLYYYVLDPANPIVPALPDEPVLEEYFNPPVDELLQPDPECGCVKPDIQFIQSINGINDPNEIIPVYTKENGEACFTVDVTAENLSDTDYYDIKIISFYQENWIEKSSIDKLAAGGTYTTSFEYCLPSGVEDIQGQVGIYYKTDTEATTYMISGSNLLNLGVFCPKALVPHDPDPNPEVSEVMRRGTVYRYYRLVNPATGDPLAFETVNAEILNASGGSVSTTYTTDVDGEVGILDEETGEFIAGVKMDWHLLTSGMAEVDYSSPVIVWLTVQGETCILPIKFEVALKEFEFEESLAIGSTVDFGASFLGAAGSIGGGANLNLGIKLKREGDLAERETLLFRGSSSPFNSKLGFKFDLAKAKVKFGDSIKLTAKVGASASAGWQSASGSQFEFPAGLLADEDFNLPSEMGTLILYKLMQNNVDSLLANHLMKEALNLSDTPLYTFKTSDFSNFSITPEAGIEAELSAGIDLSDTVKLKAKAQASATAKSNATYEREDFTVLKQDVANLVLSSEELSGEMKATAGLEAGLNMGYGVDPEDEDELLNEIALLNINVNAETGLAGGIKVVLTMDKSQQYFPQRLDVSFKGEKTFGWKSTINEKELSDFGSGEQTDIIYSVHNPEDIAKIAQTISDYGALLANGRRDDFSVNQWDITVGPTVAYEKLVTFLGLVFGQETTDITTEKKLGASMQVDFGLAGKILGTGLNYGLSLKADNFTKYIEEKAVFKGADRYTLEEYKEPDTSSPDNDSAFKKPVRGEIFKLLDEIKTSLENSLKEKLVEVVRGCQGAGDVMQCIIKTTLSSELQIDNLADYESVLGPISFGFEEIPGPVRPGYYDPMSTFGAAGKPHYGLGGFHIYYPQNQVLSKPATIILDYYDTEITGVDESSIAIYRLNEETRDWEWVDGNLDTTNNTVTTQITQLGTYTLAPAMPSGKILWADKQIDQSGANTQIVLTSEPLLMNNGEPVPDGTVFHVNSVFSYAMNEGAVIPLGTIDTEDAKPEVEGTQIVVVNGTLRLEVEYPPDLASSARIVVFPDRGTAFGDEVILFTTP
jgi:PKD repeat protein